MADKTTDFKSAFELFKPSTNIVMENLITVGVLYVIPILLGSVDSAATSYDKPLVATESAPLLSPWLMLSGLLGLIAYAPLMYFLTQVANGKKVSLADTLKGFRYFWRLLGLAIVTAVVVVLGLLLFIVPGIIFMRRYFLSPFYVIDRDMGVFEAMKTSADESKQNSGAVYSVIGVLILIALISVVGVVGLLITVVLDILYVAAPALRYFEFKKAYAKAQS